MLNNTGTWKLIDPLSEANTIGSKQVFKAKKNTTGNIMCYKMYLVAQGFSQVPDVNYFNTFASVAKFISIYAVLAITATHNMEIHQIDIKETFLNRKLTDSEHIYIQQPPSFIDSAYPFQVYYLKKMLYGLKQSRRQQYQWLCKILINKLGFTHCDIDQSMFYKVKSHRLTIILVYVDNYMIAAILIRLVD